MLQPELFAVCFGTDFVNVAKCTLQNRYKLSGSTTKKQQNTFLSRREMYLRGTQTPVSRACDCSVSVERTVLKRRICYSGASETRFIVHCPLQPPRKWVFDDLPARAARVWSKPE